MCGSDFSQQSARIETRTGCQRDHVLNQNIQREPQGPPRFSIQALTPSAYRWWLCPTHRIEEGFETNCVLKAGNGRQAGTVQNASARLRFPDNLEFPAE